MLFVSDDFVAVIDGVTSKSDFRYEGQTTGRIAAKLIWDTLHDIAADADVQHFVKKVNEAFDRFYEAVDFQYDRSQVGLQAACVVYSSHYNEVWMIGDCQARIGNDVYLNPKKSDEILADFRCLAFKILCDEGASVEALERDDKARAIILPWIVKATRFANDDSTEYGYSIFNGHPIPDSLIRKICLSEGEHEIILTSDGYPMVEKTLDESEKTLDRILREDPACYVQIHSTKGLAAGQSSFDDRTYVRFKS